MPTTRINCPNCRQPISADIEQLFDVAQDPSAKQRLLSGATNMARCPHCGYQGVIATPMVYHDPSKELLLTFFPPELNLRMDEQERMIGPLINKVVNNLPQEQRKGYLLRPQAVLTMQGMIERVLEADGITREMIQSQQKRLNLIQRLVGMSEEAVEQAAKDDDALIDAEFFSILNRLVESSMMAGDEASARALASLQRKLIPLTTAGRKIEAQNKEVQEAIHDLQELGEDLTREKLLDMLIDASSDVRMSVLASLSRPALDYEFFQLLTERIEEAKGSGRERLIQLRERLLEMTREIDRQIESRMEQSREFLNQLLKQEDIPAATEQNLGAIDDAFLQVLNSEMASARQKGDLEKIQKLGQVVQVIQQASTPPPEIELIENLLEEEDEEARQEWLEANRDKVTPEFVDTLTNLVGQSQDGRDRELSDRLQEVYRSVLRFSMKSNLQS
jgi:CpXC protein